jgi:hypothetical protein
MMNRIDRPTAKGSSCNLGLGDVLDEVRARLGFLLEMDGHLIHIYAG